MRHRQPPHHRRRSNHHLLRVCLLILAFSLLPIQSIARSFVLVLSPDELRDTINPNPNSPTSPDDSTATSESESADLDEFDGYSESKSDEDLDPGSWGSILEAESKSNPSHEDESLYHSGLMKMIDAVSSGEPVLMEEATSAIEAGDKEGDPHARSVLGFLYQMGMGRERNEAKAMLYHAFAAVGGNLQSKMALAHIYARQDMFDKAVKLYGELAEVAVNSFLISKDSPVVEPVRIHVGSEENKEALRKSRGEDDDDFQIQEYQAQKGNAVSMYKMGIFYYFGLRGLRRDPGKALRWFLKAVEKGERRSMELLGEIYVRGTGVEKNYTKALEWLSLAAKHQLYSAYNGIGYLYVKGYGVEKKNFTKAKEYFEKAADKKDPGGYYNLGVLYLKGIGVKKDVNLAGKYFYLASKLGQPKAFYQLAKMIHTGVGFKKNPQMIRIIDSLPEAFPKVEAWVENVLMEEGNATILTLFICLLTVLYLREWQRRRVLPAPADEGAVPPLLDDQAMEALR